MRGFKLIAVGVLLALTIVSGCAKEQSSAAAVGESHSRALQPKNPTLAAIYDRSCRNCHTIAASGAPLSGDSAAWGLRMEKGMDTLVDNVVSGFGGMPPLGMCMDCGVEEFEALIDFMAQADESPATQHD